MKTLKGDSPIEDNLDDNQISHNNDDEFPLDFDGSVREHIHRK